MFRATRTPVNRAISPHVSLNPLCLVLHKVDDVLGERLSRLFVVYAIVTY